MRRVSSARRKLKVLYLFLGITVFIIILTFFISGTYAELIASGQELKPNTSLTYYLNVSYDGVDKYGVESNEKTIAEINSDYIFVEDKIPEGLIFDGFITTEDGTIGAVERTNNTPCVGNVIDDTNETTTDTGVWNESKTEYTYHGLHYNTNTNKVSFKVKNLKAGCNLVVGIKTITPAIDDPKTTYIETRRDFYNFATSKENELFQYSNMLHTYIGSEFSALYEVTYEYEGEIPANAPTLPTKNKYAPELEVGVAPQINIEGYEFSGWESEDVVITTEKFIMPSKNVVLKGSFTSKDTKKVTYTLKGESPKQYVLPLEKNYHPETIVKLDSLKEGEILFDYRFNGWESEDVTITEDDNFEMPDKDVIITGEFEKAKYKVIYEFYDGILPPNAENFLPSEKEYYPGETINLEEVIEPEGYKFLGWHKEESFKMPKEDIVIYGEWKKLSGTFSPSIKKEIVNYKDYYKIGENVRLKITVTNNAPYEIKNVIVKENNSRSNYDYNNTYNVLTEHIASIDSIPAATSKEIYATYKITSSDNPLISATSEIKGATTDNNYELLESNYTATVQFKLEPILTICQETSDTIIKRNYQFHITNNTNTYETWITLNNNECKTIQVEPDTYRIKEIIPQEFELIKVTGAISSNDGELIIKENKDYEITFVNEFKKKGFFHSFGQKINYLQGGVN